MSVSNKVKMQKIEKYNPGIEKTDAGYAFSFVSVEESIKLVVFRDNPEEPEYSFELNSGYRNGDIFSVCITGTDVEGYSYAYETNGKYVTDPYAVRLTGMLEYGIKNNMSDIYGVISDNPYNWKNDVRPCNNPEELIIYRLHPRGFTKSESSGVKYPGTFKGITEKIPYLRGLGINAVELMPAYEYSEYDINLNYWGYSDAFYFVPKAAYSSSYGAAEDYTAEFKDMVRKFHGYGIEVIMEFYFRPDMPLYVISDCIRFWKKEYHIDGAHLICSENVRQLLAEDPFLSDMKLIYTNWHENGSGSNLYEYNEGFKNVARKLLKGDENQLREFVMKFKNNPNHAHIINYIADNNGFTLMDLVSYERKHNEANGENNRDGRDYNISWNCGEEGMTKSRKIRALRLQNRKNAMCMLLLAQGIPMIYAGDEFGNSQGGNNNAYCQDNETGWTDWSAMNGDRKFTAFVKNLILFRKKHGILHMSRELYQNDYKYYGLPDISLHGSKAWYPETDYYNRHIGIMLCGRYAGEDEDIYIAFNLHWEKHGLALPKVPGRIWKNHITTGTDETVIDEENRLVTVPPRCIAVLVNEKNS